jgi:hypothetical protein
LGVRGGFRVFVEYFFFEESGVREGVFFREDRDAFVNKVDSSGGGEILEACDIDGRHA